ncbi:MAG: hypothetical protein KA781_08440 [Aquabacterium sp.]|nr:hypothetical protein [Aquabacterium sp.]
MPVLPEMSRRDALRWGGVALLSSLAGCAGILGPRTVVITKEELTTKISKPFPVSNRIMDLLDVKAQAPRLQFHPKDNRVGTEFDLSATDNLFKKTYQGTIGVSFGLRFEPKDLTLRLTAVKVDQIGLAGLPATLQRYLTRLGAWIAEDKLQDYPVHQFKPEDLRTADRLGYEVGDIKVTDKGLEVHLNPKKS